MGEKAEIIVDANVREIDDGFILLGAQGLIVGCFHVFISFVGFGPCS